MPGGKKSYIVNKEVVYCKRSATGSAFRIETGGHAVPEEKIETRIPRTVDNVLNALPLCDDVWVLDNSSAQEPYKKVLRIQGGNMQAFIHPLPDWASRFKTH